MANEMITYKLFKKRNGKLFPLYVEAGREMPLGVWLNAGCGELVDEKHVKASGCGGKLSLRPGFHSTLTPFTDWIGKRINGMLVQRKDTVWCRCLVRGKEISVAAKNGSPVLLHGWYRFKTNAKQKEPWIISDELMILEMMEGEEVDRVCQMYGIEPQPREIVA